MMVLLQFFALSEVRKMYPQFNFDKFIADAAHDNYPTYKLLNEWNIKLLYPLIQRVKVKINMNHQLDILRTVFPSANATNQWYMIGTIKGRSRIKYRCPLVKVKIKECPHKEECSPSALWPCNIRKAKDDLRLFTAIPRNSDLWKQIMKKRELLQSE